MLTDGFNKSIYHRLTTAELTGVYKLLLTINFPIEKINGVFTSGIQLLHSMVLANTESLNSVGTDGAYGLDD